MDVVEIQQGKTIIVAAKGRLDSNTSKNFETKIMGLAANAEASIVIDLGNVDYISSAGLRVLLMALKKVKAGRGKLALCAIQDNVREVFDISGLSTVFPIHADRDAAVQAVT